MCARRSGSSVCATIFKSARESTRCCPSRSPSAHPRVRHSLSHRPPTSGPSLPLFNSFPLPHSHTPPPLSLSLAGRAARDNFRWPGSTLPRSRCVSLSSSGFSKKYPSRGRHRHMHTLRYVNIHAHTHIHMCEHSMNRGPPLFFSRSLALTSPIAARTTSFLRCARTHAHIGRARCFFSAAFCSLFIGNERVVR